MSAPEPSEGGGMKSLARVFHYADSVSWCLYCTSFICAIGAGVMLPLTIILFGQFANGFTDLARGSVDPDSFQDKINQLTLYFVYIFIGRVALSYINNVCISIAGIRVTKKLRSHFLECTLRQDITYFDTAEAKSTSVQVTTNGNLVNNGISEKLGLALQFISQFFTAFIVAFISQPKLAGITVSIIPLILIVVGIGVSIDQKQEAGILAFYSKAGTLAEEAFSSMRTVQAFWLQPLMSQRYNDYLTKAEALGKKKSPNYMVLFSTEFFCTYAGFSLAFWQGTRMYASGEVDNVGDVATVILAIVYAASSMTQIAPHTLHLAKAASAAEELFKVIDRPSQIDSLDESGQRPASCVGDVEVRDVHFAYPTRPDTKVLNGFSLSIPAKKTTALVGASGSGKSTIVGLLERWYDANEGSMLIDGIDIRELNIRWLRTTIRMVQQEPVLFNGTVFDNVAHGLVGTPHYDISDEKKMELVQEACKSAYADEFVKDLPEKYHTEIGERAMKLSGGQKQRLAIARSIISNPQILLLDEATSALDPKAERIVQRALENVSTDRTTLVIAHKLSTIRKADNVVVMSQGSAVEQGTHEELIALDGAYARLVKAQDLGEGESYEETEQEVVDKVLTNRLSKTQSRGAVVDTTNDDNKKTLDYNLVTCLGILFRESKELYLIFFIIAVACILGGLVYPAQAVVFSKCLTTFVKTGDELIEAGDFWALMFFIIALANFVAYGTLGWTTNMAAQVLIRKYRRELFDHVLRQDMEFFDQAENGTGQLVSRLNSTPTSLMELLGFNIAIILIGLVNLLTSCILAIVVGWKLGLVITFGGIPIMIFFGWLRIHLELGFEGYTTERFGKSAGLATEAVTSIRTVSSLTLETYLLERYRMVLENILRESKKHLLLSMFWHSLSQSAQFLVMALGFWYGSRLMLSGEYSVNQFYIVYLATIFSGEAAAQFFAFSTNLTKGQKACNEILWFRRQTPSIQEGPSSDEKDFQPDAPAQIDCENVNFSYQSRPNSLVVKDIDVEIKPGQFIAFVGPSGCGKSTLIALLSRFYDPKSGAIYLDKNPITDMCPGKYRRQLALVQQEPVLYQGSIRENVAMGLSTEEITDDQINSACKAANIHEFITSLPEGMDTLCGSRGTQLSGGQRQRIAIARALVREPRLLLLDEATSALDTESERTVQAALDKAQSGRTTISVAHRLSTIKDADLIYVFEKGKIIEKGSHVQLLGKRGVYYEMCLGQSLDREVA